MNDYGDDLYEHGSDGAYMDAVLREHAREYGRDNPDLAYINTPWDTWEPNPFYHGGHDPRRKVTRPGGRQCGVPGSRERQACAR